MKHNKNLLFNNKIEYCVNYKLSLMVKIHNNSKRKAFKSLLNCKIEI